MQQVLLGMRSSRWGRPVSEVADRNDDGAQAAVQKLDGQLLKVRTLRYWDHQVWGPGAELAESCP